MSSIQKPNSARIVSFIPKLKGVVCIAKPEDAKKTIELIEKINYQAFLAGAKKNLGIK